MKNFIKSTDTKVYLSLFVYIIIVYFVISPDSYLHNLTSHIDSSVFFMCGKAWMNGMIPYVDFADSKGPLLWLIYGVGYLISHYDYVGVFWLGCLCYSFVLFFCYKIGCLLTRDIRMGYAVAVMMVMPYFYNYFEPKSEFWCQLPVVASLYCLLKEILSPTERSARMAGIVFGLSFMSAVLIKWSIGVMMLSFVASVLFLLLRRKQPIGAYFLYFVTSAALLFLPFAIYMLTTDCFGAFVHEYFMNTSRTVSDGGFFSFVLSYWDDIKMQFSKPKYIIAVSTYVFSIIMAFCYYRKHREITLLPLLCGLFFLALSIKHAKWNYYKSVNSTFAIFFVLYMIEILVQYIKLHKKTLFLVSVASLLFAVGVDSLTCFTQRSGNKNKYNGSSNKGFYDAAYVMSQIKNPTIINQTKDVGIGIGAHTLPGTRYWIGQVGATEQMKQEALTAVDQRKADFILTSSKSEMEKHAIRAGYQYYLTCMEGCKIYGPKGLKLPPKEFQVSTMDILLKRKIKFADEDR